MFAFAFAFANERNVNFIHKYAWMEMPHASIDFGKIRSNFHEPQLVNDWASIWMQNGARARVHWIFTVLFFLRYSIFARLLYSFAVKIESIFIFLLLTISSSHSLHRFFAFAWILIIISIDQFNAYPFQTLTRIPKSNYKIWHAIPFSQIICEVQFAIEVEKSVFVLHFIVWRNNL